jgi:hypothetical protein
MIPLKTTYKPGPLAQIPFADLNRAGRWLNGMSIVGGSVFHNEDGILIVPGLYGDSAGYPGEGGGGNFAWNVTGTALTLTVTPGDIELGPDTVIAWGDITSASTTVTATTGDTTYWIWVNVDVENETAEMLSGTSITALSSEEKKTICQKRIAKITLADDLVTGIARYQCGNIFIPRL